jgi:hypothetical protein
MRCPEPTGLAGSELLGPRQPSATPGWACLRSGVMRGMALAEMRALLDRTRAMLWRLGRP